jgi:hypothetical protein
MELTQDYICLKEEVGVELKPRVPNVDGLAQVIWSDETEESEGAGRSASSQLQLTEIRSRKLYCSHMLHKMGPLTLAVIFQSLQKRRVSLISLQSVAWDFK